MQKMMSKNFNAEKRNLYRVRTKMVGASVVLVFFIALISCVAIQFFDNKKNAQNSCALMVSQLKKVITENEENIREVIAYPMNGNAEDLMCGAPNEVTEKQLREVHIKVRD